MSGKLSLVCIVAVTNLVPCLQAEKISTVSNKRETERDFRMTQKISEFSNMTSLIRNHLAETSLNSSLQQNGIAQEVILDPRLELHLPDENEVPQHQDIETSDHPANEDSNEEVHEISNDNEKSKQGTLHFLTDLRIYGNRKYANPVYEYIFPVVLGVCLLTTVALVFLLVQRLRKTTSQMNKASSLLLIAIALVDMLTICFGLAEIGHLFGVTKKNHGLLPPENCQTMLVIERLSAVPHAASTWFTVILAFQRYLCISRPFSAKKYITVKASCLCILVVSFLIVSLHIIRFFDKIFLSVYVKIGNTTSLTCYGKHAHWIKNPVQYESTFAWTRIALVQFIPCVIILISVTFIVKSLRNTSRATKESRGHGPKLVSNWRQLSIVYVVVISTIVVFVEGSAGVFLSLNAWKVTTGNILVSYDSLKPASVAFDLILYVSYFVLFLLYCVMSKDLRYAIGSTWCVKKVKVRRYDSKEGVSSGLSQSSKSIASTKGAEITRDNKSLNSV